LLEPVSYLIAFMGHLWTWYFWLRTVSNISSFVREEMPLKKSRNYTPDQQKHTLSMINTFQRLLSKSNFTSTHLSY